MNEKTMELIQLRCDPVTNEVTFTSEFSDETTTRFIEIVRNVVGHKLYLANTRYKVVEVKVYADKYDAGLIILFSGRPYEQIVVCFRDVGLSKVKYRPKAEALFNSMCNKAVEAALAAAGEY